MSVLCLLGGLPEAWSGLPGISLGTGLCLCRLVTSSGPSFHTVFTVIGDQDWADSSQDQQAGFPGVGWVGWLPPGQLCCG